MLPSYCDGYWASVIQCAHEDVSEEDMRLVRVKAHEVRAMATSALFKKIRNIPAVLQAGTWKSMSTFASFYLRDITLWYLDTFFLGPVVSALRVISPHRRRYEGIWQSRDPGSCTSQFQGRYESPPLPPPPPPGSRGSH
ncbi:hypothetical protein E2C01_010462 [Portunus trituberculatus]|uniref:Uncharacterized protein n=1 Tax=Portunus trituberculatus TaxID=210409 RepID=A0A5B7D8H3_PORTR|nr:hypothetical protein [Portunus trituberculatus]